MYSAVLSEATERMNESEGELYYSEMCLPAIPALLFSTLSAMSVRPTIVKPSSLKASACQSAGMVLVIALCIFRTFCKLQ
ncbi:hypothetical protein NTGBS_100047 [Candidatus Nitrotoga sp. BS]|nr:hypothetical protein NTGBS_100047 [Candidatus Nitrotoga sp. BS]